FEFIGTPTRTERQIRRISYCGMSNRSAVHTDGKNSVAIRQYKIAVLHNGNGLDWVAVRRSEGPDFPGRGARLRLTGTCCGFWPACQRRRASVFVKEDSESPVWSTGGTIAPPSGTHSAHSRGIRP